MSGTLPLLGDDPDHQPQVKAFDGHLLVVPNKILPQNDFITIIFANHDQRFEVNKETICKASRFFANAFNTPMKELYEDKIELQEVNPSTVRRFLDYIDGTDVLLDVALSANTFIDWVQLYKFADFADVYELCNGIASITHDWFRSIYHLPFELDEVKAMVKYLPPHTGLRKLLIAAVAGTLNPDRCGQRELTIRQNYPSDLSNALLAGHRYPVISHPQCDFHEHRSWEECESCGEFRDGRFMPPFSAGSSEGW